MKVFKDQKIIELNQKFKPFWSLKRSEALLGWDMEVNMPEKASESRGAILGQLALLDQQNISLLYGDLEQAKKEESNYNDHEKGVLRNLENLKKFYTKIPPELLEEEQRVSVEANVVWRTARKNSDYNSFKPHLEKIIAIKLKEAEKLGYEKHPYNALLDLYEENVSAADYDQIFAKLIPALKQILDKVAQEKKFVSHHPLEDVKYNVQEVEKVNKRLTEILALPKDRFRMDVSTHPFMTNMSRDDVRITTRYEGVDFSRSIYSVIHESGHGIYELQIDDNLEYTPLGTAASTAFHESQSRFWENVVGRSRAFVSLITPMLKQNLSFVSSYSEEDLYRYFNVVNPGMIRVDADELTYNFHVALRYDLEKKLLAEEIKASELPSIWNDTMEEYLGIRPKNDSEGVLQDVHWSGASFGYFPTYTLGNVLAGMVWHNIRKDLDLESAIKSGNFDPIKSWLYEKIHKWGSVYPPKELALKSLGETFNPDRLLEYLRWKYLQ